MDNPPAKHWNNRYAAAAAATLALIGLAILLMYSSQHLILVIELIVIIGFVVFWFMQTRELWDYPTREQKWQKVDQVMEEVGGEQETRTDRYPGPRAWTPRCWSSPAAANVPSGSIANCSIARA